MPFYPLSQGMMRDWVTTPAIRIYRSRQADRNRLTIGLSQPILDEMGWSKSDRIVVALGAGPDAGTFQLSRGDRAGEGIRLAAFGRFACRLNVGLPAQFFGVDTAALLEGRAFPLIVEPQKHGPALRFRMPDPSADVLPLKARKARA